MMQKRPVPAVPGTAGHDVPLRVPDGLPQLQAGAHRTAQQGACLMEYVSVLAGTGFGDHPRCTDPTLAALARLVNDACSDEGRPALARFAPALVATPPAGPEGTAAVALAAVDAACTAAGEPAGLVRLRRRAERRLELVTGSGTRAGLARWMDPLHRLGPARNRIGVAVARMGALPDGRRDPALLAILAAAVAALSSRGARAASRSAERVPSTG
jgi:hypothetical protein